MTVEEGKAVINEGLYNFAADRQRSNTYESSAPPKRRRDSLDLKRSVSEDPVAHTSMVLHKLAPLIPKDLSLRLDDSQLTSMRASNATEFRASLDCFQVHTSFAPSANKGKTLLCTMNIANSVKYLSLLSMKYSELLLVRGRRINSS